MSRAVRYRIRDTISATYVVEAASGLVHTFVLAVVPGRGGPPRILFAWLDPEGVNTSRALLLPGRALLLPYQCTKSPLAAHLADGFGVPVEDAELPVLVRFLDAELPKLVQPASDPRDRSQDGDFDPVSEADVLDGPGDAEPDKPGR